MLYNKINYTADISYLTNLFITEYDISKCNINVLYTKGVIDKYTYDYLYTSERMVRQVYVGKLQKDAEITKILKAGIIEAKKMFFEANNIIDSDVLSIKNDAVFLINKKPINTKFGLIDFKEKNTYTSFYKLGFLEIYYYYNNISKEENIDVKGINDDTLKKHENYFLQFLKDIFFTIQVDGSEIALRMIKDFYINYINLQLDPGYYRNFNNESNYNLKYQTNIGTTYKIEDLVRKEMLQDININYNLNLLLQLQKIIISLYFSKNKR